MYWPWVTIYLGHFLPGPLFTWVTFLPGPLFTWVTFYLGHFLPGPLFTWVTFYLGHFLPGSLFYLGHFFTWVTFLHGSLFTCVTFYLGQFLKTWVTGYLIPVFRENCVFWKCLWKCPQDGECGSRVCKNTPQVPPPHAITTPPPPPRPCAFCFLSDSVEGRRNFAHVIICWSMKHRQGGRNMIPTCAWPILILRGVSQPTPNAPEVPRTAGVCLGFSNTHVPRYFHIFISFAPRIFVKNAI
jgi:hypothetical protein